jgi:hypothetical protein
MAHIDPVLEKQLKLRYPMLRHFTSRPFGIEIETFGLKYTISDGDRDIIPPYKITSRSPDGLLIPQLFQAQGIPLDGYVPDGEISTAWRFVIDRTIKGAGGSELVSPILQGMEGLLQAYTVLKLLRRLPGIHVNETCGFHVHHGVDREVYQCEELKRLVELMAAIEQDIYLLLPQDRGSAETCRPMEINVNEFLKECFPECGPDQCRLKRLWYSPENRHDPDYPAHRKYQPTRYHGLNLHSYWYRGTIEFRYYPSIIENPDEIIQWIIFSQFLVEMSAGQIPEIIMAHRTNKWLNMIYQVYLTFGYNQKILFSERQIGWGGE